MLVARQLALAHLENRLAASSWSATLIGAEAMRRGGWRVAAPELPEVALQDDDGAAVPAVFEAVRRPLAWFHAVTPGLTRPRPGGRLFCLRPAWALADLIAHDGAPVLLSIAARDADPADWRAACAALYLDPLCAALGLSVAPTLH